MSFKYSKSFGNFFTVLFLFKTNCFIDNVNFVGRSNGMTANDCPLAAGWVFRAIQLELLPNGEANVQVTNKR
jgi:hypothetical protein